MITINGKRVNNPIAEGIIILLTMLFLCVIFIFIFGVIFPFIFAIIMPLMFLIISIATVVTLLFPNRKK